MRILVTGSSGQIGTNLALRLIKDGHEVFGVDKRPNAWVGDAFPTLLQDLAGHSRAASTASSIPTSTSSCTWLRTRRCISSCASRTARSRTRS
jgi:nucleoside-diphosphate-sugar epimerase